MYLFCCLNSQIVRNISTLELVISIGYQKHNGVSWELLVLKNPPTNPGDMRDMVPFLGQEDPLEEGMATHSSILAWRIPWSKESGGLQSIGSQRVRHDWSDSAGMHTLHMTFRMFWEEALKSLVLHNIKPHHCTLIPELSWETSKQDLVSRPWS